MTRPGAANAVDKLRVRRAFGRAAGAYDAHTPVQEEVRARLLALALGAAPAPRRVLDVGAGTGALLAALRARAPGALGVATDLAHGMALAARERGAPAVAGDAEALPFRAGRFDLVLSSSALQWLPRLGPALAEMRRVLAPGGAVAVAFFGGETLHELREAWRAALPAGAPDRTHRFHGEAELAAALEEAGLVPEVLTSERRVERHADPLELVRALRRIGAGNAAPDRSGGLAARGALARMARHYEARHGSAGGVPATWDVLYTVARASLREP
ncbi:methyltransferase domain-containing protein [Anaeromyxobacter diazotrophicus]|uniref:Malonyl-[acyl-carrier protein] O-methyltransferase n=1 Tax=Anaeromyxobacter diazotrophicus TaxID=2590199 RepID=A0A7I9VKA0_9BACT|nr:methyltransferase domain-containing protein [Anaeromyxobacter diazotrophicus]GEJ56811.1 malonyl-[acyl-carrier protein] O-methyltransferase [Anaeromyxobacter diazotrophicus]